MNLPLKKVSVDWSRIESSLGFSVNNNYKAFYELLGAVGVDDFLFIVGIDATYGLTRQLDYTLDAYSQLREFLDDDIDIGSVWLPVGYTIDGAFLFCNENSVMITNAGFEDVEVFDQSLLDFILAVLANKIDSENLFDVDVSMVHELVILDKQRS